MKVKEVKRKKKKMVELTRMEADPSTSVELLSSFFSATAFQPLPESELRSRDECKERVIFF